MGSDHTVVVVPSITSDVEVITSMSVATIEVEVDFMVTVEVAVDMASAFWVALSVGVVA